MAGKNRVEYFHFYYIDLKYIRDLSRKDDNVMSISPQREKENRPFLGIVTLVEGKKYCIPLTSPKPKFQNRKSQIDFIKIFDERAEMKGGQEKLIGVLNINNMIPVADSVIRKADLKLYGTDAPEVRRRKVLMQKQLKWCREHSDIIVNRSNKVYKLITEEPDKNRNLTKRCNQFIELEQLLDQYQ